MKICNKMKTELCYSKISVSFFISFLFISSLPLFGQTSSEVEAPLLTFNRGRLWHSLCFGKSGPGSFNNWAKLGVSMDWPGFDATKIREDIDGCPSYLASGGIIVGCKKDKDSALAVEEWAMYSASISNEYTAKYKVTKHRKYSDNHGMLKRKSGGEEIIETVWEYNPNYPSAYEPQRQLPLRVTRRAHQWSGSRRDENYTIYEYIIKNISNELQAYKESRKVVDTLYDFYMMFSYGMQANSRSWAVIHPNESPGARNTVCNLNTSLDFNTGIPRVLLMAKSGGYGGSGASISEAFGPAPTRGQKWYNSQNKVVTGEWLAPGYAGLRLLASPPDKIRNTPNTINKVAWSEVDDIQDLGGPLLGRSGIVRDAYNVLVNPAAAFNATVTPLSTASAHRKWSLMSLGPWDLKPGDSIVIAAAEIVDGIDYSRATGPGMIPFEQPNIVASEGQPQFLASADKAQFTYDHGLRHPVPPVAPEFKVDFYKSQKRFVANQITWPDTCEKFADPDDNQKDLAGYILYRSEFLPIGPWVRIDTIKKGDPRYYSNNNYIYIDSTVDIGTSYYYSLTAYDNGRDFWAVDPSAVFKETISNKVPPLESSLSANRSVFPFVATLPSPDDLSNVLVVPNPFVIGAGASQPGNGDLIQFVNIPNPCTIRIYSVRGDLIKTINVSESDGAIASWNQATDYGQFVTSGMYIFHLESNVGHKIGKFAIVR